MGLKVSFGNSLRVCFGNSTACNWSSISLISTNINGHFFKQIFISYTQLANKT